MRIIIDGFDPTVLYLISSYLTLERKVMITVRTQSIRLLIALCPILLPMPATGLSSLAKNDPYPVFSSVDPQDYLYTREKLQIKDPELAKRKKDTVGISISPFGQNADMGRNVNGVRANLGDLTGNWGMIPLLYGPIPPGKTLAPTLQIALDNLFPGIASGDLNDGTKIDPNQQFGYFAVPLEYRKRGVRFELDADIYAGFGLQFQMGLASMSQTSTGFIDLTECTPSRCQFDPAPLTGANVIKYLMSEAPTIAKEIQLDICNYCQTSVEEIRALLFWRRGFELNGEDDDWASLLLIPFWNIGGTVSPGNENRFSQNGFNRAFAVPFGNNNHSGVGFTVGLDIDFIESIEIGAEVGMTYFFKKNFEKFRVPNSPYQSGIYPFTTDVSIQPGYNWNFGAKIACFHFLERLSGYFEYIQVEHKPDDIKLRKCQDEGFFLPQQLECQSGFKAKFIDAALNYDISPNIALGVFWQAPISQLNSYRVSTIMLSFNATF